MIRAAVPLLLLCGCATPPVWPGPTEDPPVAAARKFLRAVLNRDVPRARALVSKETLRSIENREGQNFRTWVGEAHANVIRMIGGVRTPADRIRIDRSASKAVPEFVFVSLNGQRDVGFLMVLEEGAWKYFEAG